MLGASTSMRRWTPSDKEWRNVGATHLVGTCHTVHVSDELRLFDCRSFCIFLHVCHAAACGRKLSKI